jgi:hypothetical protein
LKTCHGNGSLSAKGSTFSGIFVVMSTVAITVCWS